MAMKSLTFGVMPSRTAFDAAFDREVGSAGYNYELRGSDARAAGAVGVDASGRVGAAKLYGIIKKLADSGDEQAESVASSFLYTLGFEWI